MSPLDKRIEVREQSSVSGKLIVGISPAGQIVYLGLANFSSADNPR